MPTDHALPVIVLGVLTFMILVFTVASWEVRDASMATAIAAYEDCVSSEYNTTPSAYYQQHGEYPVCNSNL